MMKHLKGKAALITAISVISIGSAVTASAAEHRTPADIVASLTGKAVANVIQERSETGKTFGMLAAEAGKLEEFKSEMLAAKEEVLNENVENGVISPDQADEILNTIEANQAVCDGTGNGAGLGCVYGSGAGNGPGCGYGNGAGNGNGCGYGNGAGNGPGCGYGNGAGSGLGRGNGNGWGRGQGAGRGR